ncbi:MAG TPA: UDP-N-acetylglucosamine 2-epimerase (non-hydrolyzing) [Sphingomicrobium sp.]|nr:UDP-N-acetylglucosamine 2-epimerase (non-hydrolyzing) [Sphingomicrobium sp.]
MTVALIVGTRPEAIKLAPVYRALDAAGAAPVVVLTGQHDALIDPLIALFGLERRIDLGARVPGDTLTSFAARCLERLGHCYADEQFSAVVVQGDTTSALAGALAAAYAGIPVAHVEAGLRSGDLSNPFPEEMNRRMIADTARWHFAPTTVAADNLHREGRSGDIHLVGNSVVDSALWVARRRETRALVLERFPKLAERPHMFVTAHRRESFGRPMRAIADAIGAIATREPETELIVALHPNPNASAPLAERLCEISNLELTEPLSYPLTIGLVASADMILTDSGGLQEEAPSFGVPVLVLREVTERPEGVEAGCSRIAGTTSAGIVAAFERWRAEGPRPAAVNPFGDGRSGERIADILLGSLAGLREAC